LSLLLLSLDRPVAIKYQTPNGNVANKIIRSPAKIAISASETAHNPEILRCVLSFTFILWFDLDCFAFDNRMNSRLCNFNVDFVELIAGANNWLESVNRRK